MQRFFIIFAAVVAVSAGAFFATTDRGYACAGLIGSNGAVNLGRTTTLAGYHDGVEHYLTSFEFQGGGGQFGTLIPLPDVPSKVERGGAWTLQRLARETEPPKAFAVRAAAGEALSADAQVLIEVRIDALDITVLKGGAPAVAKWAQDHGFRLSPDAPEVLEFYADRSQIFLAAVFDGDAAKARGQQVGDGTPVHLTIPTARPWVPLRVLALGKKSGDRVDADVYLLTDAKPRLLPAPGDDMRLLHSDRASSSLLNDLRSDDGGEWVPASSWLTKLRINASAEDMTYDLSVDPTGKGQPSAVAAGIEASDNGSGMPGGWFFAAAGLVLAVVFAFAYLTRRLGKPAATK